jgi:hypothetical protein
MKPTVYIDTTIPSYYVDERQEIRLHIERPRQWWDHERAHYEVYISDLVSLELQEGSYPRQDEALALISSLPRLAPSLQIAEIVEALPGPSPDAAPGPEGRFSFGVRFILQARVLADVELRAPGERAQTTPHSYC